MMPTIITMATMVAVTLPLPHSLWQGSFGFWCPLPLGCDHFLLRVVSQCRHNSPACFIAWKVGRFNDRVGTHMSPASLQSVRPSSSTSTQTALSRRVPRDHL